MALTFGAATSDRVEISSSAEIDDLTTFTVLCWAFPTAANNSRRLWQWEDSGDGVIKTFFRQVAPNTRWGAVVVRATTNSDALTDDFTLNAWQFFGLTYDESDGSQAIHIYRGTLTTTVAEVTYTSFIAGTGTTTADDGTKFVGNVSGADVAFDGRIATYLVFNRVLSLGEMRGQQFFVRNVAGCVNFFHLGFNGTGTQPDWSGNGNSGTVTGATVGDHVPLGPPFGFDIPVKPNPILYMPYPSKVHPRRNLLLRM